MNRLPPTVATLLAAGALAAGALAGTLALAAPAAAGGNDLECSGTARWTFCDLNANGSGADFSNQRWTLNGVAYPNGDSRPVVKFYCPPGSPYIVIGVNYTDSAGTGYAEATEWYCQ